MNALPPSPLGRDLRLTRTLNWRDKVWLVDVSFDTGGHALKLNVEEVKEGDPDRYLLLDAVGLLNALLALGVPLPVIRSEYVVRVYGGPVSIIGALVELVHAMEIEDRPAIMMAYELVRPSEPGSPSKAAP